MSCHDFPAIFQKRRKSLSDAFKKQHAAAYCLFSHFAKYADLIPEDHFVCSSLLTTHAPDAFTNQPSLVFPFR